MAYEKDIEALAGGAFWCAQCRENKVQVRGDICRQCVIDRERGYRVRSLAGRCANGAELDHGTRFHALKAIGVIGDDTNTALCGAKPGRRSVGWTTWGSDQAVTCPKCLKKLERSRSEKDQNSKEPS